MKKLTKTMTIVASSMIVIGILLAVIGYSAGARLSITNAGGSFKVVEPEEREMETTSLSSFSNIDINLFDADIEMIPSNEYKVQIERNKGQKIIHEIKNDTLFIEEKEKKKPKFINFNINLGFTHSTQTVIKIYFPSGESLSEVNFVNHFGNIRLDDMITKKLTIRVSDGDVAINNVQANELKIVNQFGDILGENVQTKELNVESNDGEAVFNKVNADSVNLKNSFGDTTFQNVTSKGMNIESNDGVIDIQGMLLGNSIIHSNFGDVNVQLQNKESEIGYKISNDFGDIIVNNNEFETQAVYNLESINKLEIKSKDGDVNISF